MRVAKPNGTLYNGLVTTVRHKTGLIREPSTIVQIKINHRFPPPLQSLQRTRRFNVDLLTLSLTLRLHKLFNARKCCAGGINLRKWKETITLRLAQ